MDIQEVRNARHAMEIRIRTEVERAVAEFTNKTGLAPSAIHVEMIDVTSLTSSQFVTGEVRAEVSL